MLMDATTKMIFFTFLCLHTDTEYDIRALYAVKLLLYNVCCATKSK